MFKDISELLDILGCYVELKVKSKVDKAEVRSISEKELAEMLENLSAVFEVKPGETVGARIKVLKNSKPYAGARVKATIVYPSRGKTRKHSITLTADNQGTVTMPVPKFSMLRVSANGHTEEILVVDRDVEVELRIAEETMIKKILKLVTIGVIVAGLTALVLILLQLLTSTP